MRSGISCIGQLMLLLVCAISSESDYSQSEPFKSICQSRFFHPNMYDRNTLKYCDAPIFHLVGGQFYMNCSVRAIKIDNMNIDEITDKLKAQRDDISQKTEEYKHSLELKNNDQSVSSAADEINLITLHSFGISYMLALNSGIGHCHEEAGNVLMTLRSISQSFQIYILDFVDPLFDHRIVYVEDPIRYDFICDPYSQMELPIPELDGLLPGQKAFYASAIRAINNPKESSQWEVVYKLDVHPYCPKAAYGNLFYDSSVFDQGEHSEACPSYNCV